MAKSLGKDDMVWLESSTPGTYNLIAGQGDAEINRNAEEIDTTTKDDSGYGTSDFGLKRLEVSLNVIPNLPDTNGFTRLQTLINANPQVAFNIQIRKNGASGSDSDKIFACSVKGVMENTTFPQSGARGVRVRFRAQAAPTTDALA